VKKGPVNSYSLKWSLALHGVLLFLAVLLPLMPMFRRKELAIPLEFTVVLEQNLDEPNVPDEPEKMKEPEPEPEPDPEPLKPLPVPEPVRDAVVMEKKKEPEKKKPETKEPEKKEPEKKKPEPPKPVKKPVKKPEFKKGKRVEAPKKPPQPRFEEMYKPFDPSKAVTRKPVTDKKLSRAEIDKALRDGARPGVRNEVPADEISRCVLLVRNALYEAWEQPGEGESGPRPALLDIRLDSGGRIVSYRIRQSSGNTYFDQTVLKAAANAAPIRGLSLAFLKQYETLTVEFKLE